MKVECLCNYHTSSTATTGVYLGRDIDIYRERRRQREGFENDYKCKEMS